MIVAMLLSGPLAALEPRQVILPEQRRLQIRGPEQMTPTLYGAAPKPATVTQPQEETPERFLPLNEAINIALRNSEVVRVLGGITANTSGRTIYDVAITNTGIDQQRAAFDPQLRINNGWNANRFPTAVPNPIDPTQTDIVGGRTHNHAFDLGLSKQNQLGGISDLSVNANQQRFPGDLAPLDPQNRSNVDLSYTQPLLQGAGLAVNQAPIVLARIETERSYFQYKESVQRLVQGVIEAYWALVFAKTDLWAREQQVKQAAFAFERTTARVAAGDANAGELAQSKLALENFRASLLASQANVLQRQAALMNILGYPPYEPERLTPVTPMVDQLIEIDWELINDLAARQRPDIIELKLILDADRQRLIQADNQAQPRLDTGALYRWNGLEGEVPAGNRVRSDAGEFNDWSLTVNFAVPLGLRRERALLRQTQLLIRRDQANLNQGLHAMQHLLALNLRNLDQFYAQYERFKSVRQAAEQNLELQLSRYNEGVESFIVVLQAIVDWGNSVSSEAQSLSQYNIELAALELQTGTILESHGVVFYEERFQSIGPFGRCGNDRCYPEALPPSDEVDRYPTGDQPSEENFDLQDPVQRRQTDDADDDRSLDIDAMEQEPEFSEEGEQPLTDPEIDELIDPAKRSGWLPMFWKNPFRR
jgi:outer membrane protein TolC